MCILHLIHTPLRSNSTPHTLPMSLTPNIPRPYPRPRPLYAEPDSSTFEEGIKLGDRSRCSGHPGRGAGVEREDEFGSEGGGSDVEMLLDRLKAMEAAQEVAQEVCVSVCVFVCVCLCVIYDSVPVEKYSGV